MPLRPQRVAVRLFAIALVIASACAGGSRHPRSPGPHLALGEAPASYRFRGTYYTYPSGMRMVAVETEEAPSVSVAVAYALAGLPEPAGKAGLGMLAARVADRGGMVRGGLRAGERLFALGAYSSVYVDDDALSFHAWVRPRSYEALLEIEASRLHDPTSGLDDEEIEGARERLARELELERDGDRPLLSALARRALAGTRYAREEVTSESVRALAPEDVRGYLRAALRPERAVVVVIGPRKADGAARAVELAFGEGGPRSVTPVSSPLAPLPPTVSNELLRVPGRSQERMLWIGWPIPGQGAHRAIPAILAAQELVTTLRQRASRADLDPLVKWVEGNDLVRDGAGLLYVRVALSDAADVELVRARLVEAAEALGADFDDHPTRRLDRRRRELTFGIFRQVEEGVVAGIPALVRTLDEPSAATEWNRQLDEAPYSVPALFRNHVRKDRAVAILAEKARQAEPAPEASEVTDEWVRATNLLATAAPGATEVRALLQEPPPAGAVRRTLPNGLEVVVLPRGSFPTVQVSLFVKGDSESPVARARKRAALRAIELTSRWRLSPHRSVAGGFEFHENGPAAWLPYYLANVGCWTWTRPRLGKVEDVIDDTVEGDRNGRTEGPEGGAYGAVQEAFTSRDGEPVKAITPMVRVEASDVVREFPGWFRPDRATLVITGKVAPTEALWNDVQDAVGTWTVDGPPTVEPPAPAGPERRRVLLFDYPGAKHAVASIIARTPLRGARNEGAHLVLAEHMEQLAVQLAFPRGATVTRGGRDGMWLSSIRVTLSIKGGELPHALSGFLDDLERLRRVPISPVDLDLARWNAARREAFAHDSLPHATSLLGEAALRGQPVDALSVRDALAGVAPAAVHAYAGQVLGREIIAVQGDAKRLAPALKAAGLEPELVALPRQRE